LIGKIVRHDGISVTLLVKRLRRQAREFPLKTGRHNYFAGGLRRREKALVVGDRHNFPMYQSPFQAVARMGAERSCSPCEEIDLPRVDKV
ncbi:MAG: hypothetical protein ACYC7E_23410, partial [Armatimonadota bacterium]